MTSTIVIFLLGTSVAGFIAGLLGLGGGMVLVPLLIFVLPTFGVDSYVVHIAIATSLVCIIFSGSIAASAHNKKGAIDSRIALYWGVFSIVGAMLGSLWASYAPGKTLRIIYVIVLACLSIYRLLCPDKVLFKYRDAVRQGLIFPLLTGCIASTIGIGGGNNVPLLSLYGVSIQRAIGTSTILGVCIAIVSTLVYLYTGLQFRDSLPAYNIGFVNVPAFLAIVPIVLLTAPLGVKLSHTLQSKTLNGIFCLISIGMALYIFWGILLS